MYFIFFPPPKFTGQVYKTWWWGAFFERLNNCLFLKCASENVGSYDFCFNSLYGIGFLIFLDCQSPR